MSLNTNHEISEENMNTIASDEALPAQAASTAPTVFDPRETVLLADKKNTIEIIHREAREETIINGKYILDSEDETYFYVYYQTTYKTRVMKDSAKKNIKYRDEKGRLLPGFSLVKETKDMSIPAIKSKTRKRYTKKSAEKYLENDLIADLIEDIQTADMSDKDRVNAKLALVNYVKPTLSKVQTEKVITIQNDEFEDAVVVDEEDKNDENE